MKPIANILGGICIAALALVATTAVVATSAYARQPTHAVCWSKDPQFRTWHEYSRPHRCNLHAADFRGVTSRSVMLLRHLHWSRWGPNFAHGRGKLKAIPGRFEAPPYALDFPISVQVSFGRPTTGWGPSQTTKEYFSKAVVALPKRGYWSFSLDVPQHYWLSSPSGTTGATSSTATPFTLGIPPVTLGGH